MLKILKNIKRKYQLNKYIGCKFPYNILTMQLLDKTNMFYTYCYIKELDCTMKVNKERDIIEKIWIGKKWQVI
jgi:hypothetical protein